MNTCRMLQVVPSLVQWDLWSTMETGFHWNIAILRFGNVICGTYHYLGLKIQPYTSQRTFGPLRQGRTASVLLGG
jgi:hypothetical protein